MLFLKQLESRVILRIWLVRYLICCPSANRDKKEKMHFKHLLIIQFLKPSLYFTFLADPGVEVICVCRQRECGLVLKCLNNECLISEYHGQCVNVEVPTNPSICDDCSAD